MAVDMSPSVKRRLKQYQTDFISQDASFNEQWTLYPGGIPTPIKTLFKGIRVQDGRMAMWCEGHAVADEFDTPEHLRSIEALLHTAVMISLYDKQGNALYRNPAARESVKQLDETLLVRLGDAQAHGRMLADLDAHGIASLTLPVKTTRGERWLEMSARCCKDAVTGMDAVLVSEVDVSAIKRTEARAHFLATHDSLTGLPNRSHVEQQFADTIDHIRSSGLEAALFFIDLDNFKDVNDTLGHAAGDELLIEMSKRLGAVTRSSDLVARFGGDEFLILTLGTDIHTEAERLGNRLLSTIAQPVVVNGLAVEVTTSLGVSLFPRDGNDIETLLRHADLAMYSAKERGRNGLAFFNSEMSEAVLTRTGMEAELRHAMERGEFEVFYQPQIDVRNGQIYGAEALVRWRHPKKGLISPDRFIPLCEKLGLIVKLGAFVFEQAARQQVAWALAGHDLQLGVNLSPRQFRDPELMATFTQALAAAKCSPHRMQVEITESVLIGHDARPLETLESLRNMGLSVALDDFGTGYSNLGYLRRFPINTLKIDKAFIQGDEENLPLAALIVSMCRLMKLSIVAEGVETPAQLAWVASQGIESYQGYLFSRPLDATGFTQLLNSKIGEQPTPIILPGAPAAPAG